jgi:hypothetical protein
MIFFIYMGWTKSRSFSDRRTEGDLIKGLMMVTVRCGIPRLDSLGYSSTTLTNFTRMTTARAANTTATTATVAVATVAVAVTVVVVKVEAVEVAVTGL